MTLKHDLGTFEGFNFRDQAALDRNLTADEVLDWDHDGAGEAEFWPAGDHPGVAALFSQKSAVSGSELKALDDLLCLDRLAVSFFGRTDRMERGVTRFGVNHPPSPFGRSGGLGCTYRRRNL